MKRQSGVLAKNVFETLRPARLTKYQWQRMDPQRLHNELREVWALVTEHPGCTLRFIAKEVDVPLSRLHHYALNIHKI